MPALGVVAVVAIALRFTVRDRLPILSAFFYATPFPLLLLACTSMALLLSVRRQWKAAAVAAGLGLLSGGLYVRTSHVSSAGSTGDADLKVLFWNAARGKGGASQVMAHAARADADLIGLVETGGKRVASHENWKRHFPGYQVTEVRGGMRLLVRGELLESRYVTTGNRTRFKVALVRVFGRPLRVVVADLGSNPLASRRAGFEALEELIDERPDMPLIVMGDFNTPLESVHFNRLRRRGFTNAFVSAGHGFSETWPALLPLLSLDHIWTGPGLRPIRCELQRSPASDHLSVLAAIDVGVE